MYWFITVGIILILAIIGIIVANANYYENLYMGSWLAAIIAGCILIIMTCTIINIDKEFEATINEYEVLKEQVECYTPGDYGNATDIMTRTLDMNKKIAKHKAMANSKWSGPWFSEEIGNLEPIILGKK